MEPQTALPQPPETPPIASTATPPVSDTPPSTELGPLPPPKTIPSPDDPIVTSNKISATPELVLPEAPEETTAPPVSPAETPTTEAAPASTAANETLPPPATPQAPPIVPPTQTIPTPPSPSVVSEAVAPQKKGGSKLVLVGVILLVVFLAGYAFVTFSGVLSK